MAHVMGMKVVAEGVETQEQLDFLRANNCDEIQGFLLAKPDHANKVRGLLQLRSAKECHETLN